MASTIKLKNGSGAPTAGDLVQGEPALDLTNKRLYTEDAGGTVVEVGTNPTALTIGGTALTATATELNYTDGVTSNIQTQLNTKAPIDDATFTGTTTIPTADINGGTIDGVTIGGASAGEGTFTTVTVAEGLVHAGDSDTYIKFLDNRIYSDVDGKRFLDLQSGTSELNSTGSVEFNTGASLLKRLNIANNGDISFYEDTGTTPKFYWDASAESLGIGTGSPEARLDINGNTPSLVTIRRDGGADTNTGLRFQLASDFWITGAGGDGNFGIVKNNLNITTSSTFRITGAGNVGIGTSSPAKALDVSGAIRASTGILFGSDTAAANTLDDYEEGTFTATLQSAGNTGATTLTSNVARYTKIGDVVHIFCAVTGDANLCDAGDFFDIGGLPFAATVYAGSRSPFNGVSRAGSNLNDNRVATGVCSVQESTTKIDVYTNVAAIGLAVGATTCTLTLCYTVG